MANIYIISFINIWRENRAFDKWKTKSIVCQITTDLSRWIILCAATMHEQEVDSRQWLTWKRMAMSKSSETCASLQYLVRPAPSSKAHSFMSAQRRKALWPTSGETSPPETDTMIAL